MIDKKTIFILGAGASVPYGFPIGSKLKNEIIELFKNEIKDNWDKKKLGKKLDKYKENEYWNFIASIQGFDGIKEFIESLRRSGKSSVDAFLEHRTEFIPIGKALISTVLINCENENNLFSSEHNWYEYLYSKMNATKENFSKNQIAILTFNYDRSLEYYFLNCIKNSYGVSIEEAANELNKIPIIHLHGILGYLNEQSNNNCRPYNQTKSPDNIDTCINNIKIISEESIEKEQFSKAREFLYEAECICFLGFGYDETNLNRLNTQIFKEKEVVYGSSYGLTVSEIRKIEEIFGYYKTDTYNSMDYILNTDRSGKLDVLEYLRNNAYEIFG